MLFTKYNVEDALEVKYEEGKQEGGIKTLIETCQELGVSADAILLKLMQKFSMEREDAENYLREYQK